MNKVDPATTEQKSLIKKLITELKQKGGYDTQIEEANTIMRAKPDKVKAGALIMDLEELAEE